MPLSEIVLLHFLGGSARSWAGVQGRLGRSSVALDLSGFGDAAGDTARSVGEMADRVVARMPGGRHVLVGHSMGAKVAMAIARAHGAAGLVLIAGSPPSPEPMEDAQREKMLRRFSSGIRAQDLAEARDYIDENCGEPLPVEELDRAVEDVLRMDVSAWRDWLERGSREDWSDRVGVLSMPALILAGEKDTALGVAAQRSRMAPHFEQVRIQTLAGAGHLMPLEQPETVARLIEAHAAACFQPG